jgi:choline dehydrogenase
VLFQMRRASGVRYLRGGAAFEARASREVILAAGALQSPQLLQLSGIGPARLLQQHGIGVLRDCAGVGENLQDHLALRLIYKATRPVTTNDDLRTIFGKARVGLQYLLRRRGPLAIGVMTGGLIATVLEESRTPDMQVFLSTVSAEQRGAAPHPWSGFTIVYYPMRPTSRGHVRIKSASALDPPAMQPNYLGTPYDRRIMVAGARLVRRLIAAPSLSPYVKEEHQPGAAMQSDEEILDAVRAHGSSGYHPVGTCRMGEDEKAVVDSRLRVHGVDGLRVIDASVMPTLVSGNTNAATIMIAEKGADLVLEDLRAGT